MTLPSLFGQAPDARRHSLVSAISEPVKSGWRGAKGIFEMAQVKMELQQSRLVTKSYRDNLTELSELRNNFPSISLDRSQKIERVVDRALSDIQRSEDLLKEYCLDGTKPLRKVAKVLRWKLTDKRTFSRYQNRVEQNDSSVRDEIHEFKLQTLNKQVQQILSCRIRGARQGIPEAPKGPKRRFHHWQLPNSQGLQDSQYMGLVTGQTLIYQDQESLSSCSTTSIDSAPGPSSLPRAYIFPTSTTAQRASATVTTTHRGSLPSRNESPVTYPAIPLRTSSSIPLKNTLIRVIPSSLRNGSGKTDQKGKGKAIESESSSVGMEIPLECEGESMDEQLQNKSQMHFPDGDNMNINESINANANHATYSNPPQWEEPDTTASTSEHESRQLRLPPTDTIPTTISTANTFPNINDGLDLSTTHPQHNDTNGPDTSTEIASSIEEEAYDGGSPATASKPVGRGGDGGIA